MAVIKVEGKAQDYDAQPTLDLVRAIKGRPVGRQIVEAVEGTGKQLTIRPASERPKASYDKDRAYTGPEPATFRVDSARAPNYAAASPANLSTKAPDGRGKWYGGTADNPDTDDIDERFNPPLKSLNWGNPKGGGSDVDLYF